jgi:hypothetical protein
VLNHRLDARDRVCLLCFNADAQSTATNVFVETTDEGKKQLDAALGVIGAASSPTGTSFIKTLQQGLGYVMLHCFTTGSGRPH